MNRLYSGWDFATSDRDVCDAGFDFGPSWQGCGEDKATAGASGLDAHSADELDDSVLNSVDRAGVRFDDFSRQLLDTRHTRV